MVDRIRRGRRGGPPRGTYRHPVGSGRTLNDGQAAWLRTILNEKAPEDVGIASPLWTRRAVANLIRKEYEIDMPVRTVGEYLRRWGYTPKVPSRHAKDQDPEEVRRWLEETYPAIEQRAAREGAEIYWCDETGGVADQQPRRGYAREGQPARIDVPDPHIRMNRISTISNEGSVHFMTYKQTMTAALFITFLERLLGETTQDLPDRGSAEGPRGEEGRRSGCGPSGADRDLLPPKIRAGAEPGRVLEQRHEGGDQRDWPA